MNPSARSPALAPFGVRSFRFQWPADLAASWAFEMETLVLGWYVLTATGSVRALVLFGALQWAGSLVSPLFGVAGDRIGHRTLLYGTRAIYALLAGALMLLSLTGAMLPWHAFVIAGIAGLIRPSDLMLRQALVAQTMTGAQLLGALSISRTTADSARIAGALAGAGGVAAFGMGPVYALITLLYVASYLLSLGVAGAPVAPSAATASPATPADPAPASPWRDLCAAFTYVWSRPELLAAMALAFLVNMLAFPFSMGLLPYIAREIYAVGQTGLGYLAAGFATGGLIGSVLLSTNRVPLQPARSMLAAGAAWFITIFAFAQSTSLLAGVLLLMLAGVLHNFCLMPLAAVMLRGSAPEMRGRVMGMRMLAIWGMPLGLLVAGPLIANSGFVATASLFTLSGLGLTAAIALRWRDALWRPAAPANARL
jgi:hypothetical protein